MTGESANENDEDTVASEAFDEWWAENKEVVFDMGYSGGVLRLARYIFRGGWNAAQAADVWE